MHDIIKNHVETLAQIGSENSITITVGIGGSLALGIFWKVAQFVKGIRDDLRELKRSVWSVTDQDRWATRLSVRNPKLDVPDAFQVKHGGHDSLHPSSDSKDPFTG